MLLLFLGLQELRLGTVGLSHLDLENCGHLREVQLSEASARPAQQQEQRQDGKAKVGAGWVDRRSCIAVATLLQP